YFPNRKRPGISERSGDPRRRATCSLHTAEPESAWPKRKRQPEGCLFVLHDHLVINCTAATDTGLAANSQGIERITLFISTSGLVGNREEPDREESQRDGEDTRVRERRDGFGVAEHVDPHGFAQHHPQGGDE